MEVKKSKKADLKNKQGLFLQVGMLVALALVFVSFQWSISEKRTIDLAAVSIDDYESDLTEIKRIEIEEKKLELIKKQAEKFIIMEDNELIDDEDKFIVDDLDSDIPVAVIPIYDEDDEDEPEIFVHVERMPQFPGGDRALLKFLAEKTIYPEIAKENGIQGRVFVSFVINKKGEVVDIRLARGVDPSLDKEALRVVSLLPKWTPGKQREKAVNVAFNVPINFRLN